MNVVPYLIGIAVIVVGLAVSIALHEIGHLVPAKRFGVRVGQYMIGFGPTLWSRRIGETQYGFKAIPLGGYISMAGMYPPSPTTGQSQTTDAAHGPDAPVDRDGGQGSRTDAGHRPGRAGGGFFATMVQDARSANDETIEGADERVFYKLPVWKRVVIMLGGPVMNLLFAIVLFAILFSGIGVQQGTTTVATVAECVAPAGSAQTECAASDPVAPAAAGGMLPGDVMVSIDGTDVSTFDEASAIIRESPGEPLQVVVDRDGERVTLQVTPLLAERPAYDDAGRPVVDEDGTTVTDEVGFIGVGPVMGFVRQPIWTGPEAAIENVGAVAGIIVQLPVKLYAIAESLFTGSERDPNGPLSVVGVGLIAGEVAAQDAPVMSRVAAMLGLVASLNVALFVFNLIPLLPLDGGHIVVALWEGIKRAWAKLFRRPPPKPVDATKLVPITFVVVIALIGMGGLLLVADILNPVQLFN
ncbi:MAG TPA: M50 family metallopeptidase [Microbacterium sp.]|uniref:M50 family metallopeptidase n=1 Tax=Microbacterium sp. TaxID=51671 RepID=UPI002C22321E|nr:M50 family metallopeptidase [Microbacterium sp.]HWI31443.1 M50 family metallopeptidase [Microbacterium sp.]